MKTWQVLLLGEGFTVDGVLRSCEISGFVKAESVAAAVEKAEAITRCRHSELEQAAGAFPRPVINAEEVLELGDDLGDFKHAYSTGASYAVENASDILKKP